MPTPHYERVIAADKPAWWWPLRGYFQDYSGNGNHFTMAPGVRYNQTALCSDGGVAIGSHNAGGTDLGMCWRPGMLSGMSGASTSLEVWVKVPASTTGFHGTLISVGNITNGWGFGVGGTTFDNDGANLILVNSNIAWVTTGVTLSAGTHHIVVTRSAGNSFTAYVDGVSVFTGSFTPTTATTYCAVGGGASNHPLAPGGIIVDNAAYYPSVLSGTRVAAHYAATNAAYDTAVLADSPVAYLKFDALNGDVWGDNSGGSTWLDPVVGNPQAGDVGPKKILTATTFAAGDYAYTNPETTTSSSEDFSLELWIKTTASGASKMLCAKDDGGGSNRNWNLQYGSTGIISFGVFDSGLGFHNAQTTATINDGNWHHIVGVYDHTAQTITVYIDAVQQAQATGVAITRNKTSEIVMLNKGDNAATSYSGIAASYAQVAGYAKALTSAQVTNHYNAASVTSRAGWGIALVS